MWISSAYRRKQICECANAREAGWVELFPTWSVWLVRVECSGWALAQYHCYLNGLRPNRLELTWALNGFSLHTEFPQTHPFYFHPRRKSPTIVGLEL
ncbi:Anthranilate N-benzoyltransferase 2 [Gossypium arboreum]|uniref:Anthranilate N-benzoyltransferase 2 n=1 Tax=Gossypium arboreum TaxID=29729 RepID=A0A0B0PRS5_GOSAR|nr:Anthranilate N-benzoyltransferase 2 [Gossypium arboreum]